MTGGSGWPVVYIALFTAAPAGKALQGAPNTSTAMSMLHAAMMLGGIRGSFTTCGMSDQMFPEQIRATAQICKSI